MSDSKARAKGPRQSRSPRRPSRVVVGLVTLVAVLVVAIAVPTIVSTPAGGPGLTPGPTRAAAAGTPAGQASGTERSSFPAPVGTPFPSPTTPSTSPASSVPLSPAPARVGVEATRIRIDRLSIDLPIIEGDGIDAPLFKAAHYPGTAWPRGGSNIYIYGHAQERMFLSLWQARVGDEVVLDLIDGSEAVYVVAQVIPEARWNDLSLLEPTPLEQLTLQTSTSDTETAPRFVVIAQPRA